jgi:hypothetical protein
MRSPRVLLAAAAAVAVIAAAGPALAAPPAGPAAQPAPASEPEFVLIDALSPFYDEARPAPRSWAMPFAHMDLAEPPYVAHAHMERAVGRFGEYCAYVASLGYTGVTLGNLIHLATFDRVPDGPRAVYPEGSPFRIRAEQYKAYYRRCVDIAHEHGLRVVLDTDFPAFTPPLLRWLGPLGASPANERIYVAYRAAIAELFDEVGADALSVRIGEGGGAYDEQRTGYASSVAVRTVADCRRVVSELLSAVEADNARTGGARHLLFRTWTIGLGEIGALHTSPALYDRVFSPFYGHPALVTLIKHVAMDFFQYVPRNPTIGVGGLRQVVEVQARREFEGFGLFPNYRGPAFEEDMRVFRGQPQFAGVSVWTTNGGFWLRAPIFYHAHGPDEWIDLNAWAYARMVKDATLTPRRAAEEWAALRGLAPDDAARAADILMRSADVVRRGMYVGGFASTPRALFGLDVIPTMMWFWWTRPVGAYGVQSMIFRAVKDDIAGCIAEGAGALADAERMLADARRLPESALRARLVESLGFERSLLSVLAAYRRVFLRHYAWALGGAGEDFDGWRAGLVELRRAMSEHEATYGGSPYLPAMDFCELERLVRDDGEIVRLRPWAALLALVDLSVAALILFCGRRLARTPAFLAAAGCALLAGASAALFVCGYRAWHVAASVALPLGAAWVATTAAIGALRPRGSEAEETAARPRLFAAALALWASRSVSRRPAAGAAGRSSGARPCWRPARSSRARSSAWGSLGGRSRCSRPSTTCCGSVRRCSAGPGQASATCSGDLPRSCAAGAAGQERAAAFHLSYASTNAGSRRLRFSWSTRPLRIMHE